MKISQQNLVHINYTEFGRNRLGVWVLLDTNIRKYMHKEKVVSNF
jgi:hypothetical protein